MAWTTDPVNAGNAAAGAFQITGAARTGCSPDPTRAEVVYTLVETAKLSGVDPEAYLRHVIACIADHPAKRIAELLPWNVNF